MKIPKERSPIAKKKTAAQKRYLVPAVKRAFAILDTLNQSSFGLTVQEVSNIHKIPYSTAFYLLETMLESGYAERNNDTKKYMLGNKLFAFREGSAARNTRDLRAVAFPILEELTEITGLTGHLAILEKSEAVYIEKSETSGFIRLNTWVGERKLVHCTGVGKALLMHLPPAEIRRILEPVTLERRTERTITNMDELLKNLGDASERGWALDDAEDESEGRGIAAAVWGREGKVVASMGLAGTLNQLDLRRVDGLGKLIRNYALTLSYRLGYVPADDRAVDATDSLSGRAGASKHGHSQSHLT
jgi:DNA-binding IclR family transcriptional regulator